IARRHRSALRASELSRRHARHAGRQRAALSRQSHPQRRRLRPRPAARRHFGVLPARHPPPTDATSGLTAHRLKALCAEQDVCSPGRARAMLSLLQLFGYIAPAPGSDRRYKLLAPTALLTAFLRERWRAMFAAIALLKPEGAAARAALARDDFLAALTRAV